MMKRTLKKINDNAFLLIREDKQNRYRDEKGFTKKELRENYRLLAQQRQQGVAIKKELEKKLSRLNVLEDTPELRDFLKKLELAEKLKEKKSVEDRLKMIKKDFDMIVSQMREIEVAVPEVVRALKKQA